MTNNNQSSVDWLISQLQKSKDWNRVLNEISQMSSARVDIIEQAKEMEKERIETAYNKGTVHGIDYPESTLPLTGEQYYEQTYGGNK